MQSLCDLNHLVSTLHELQDTKCNNFAMITCKMVLSKSTHRQKPSLKGINVFKIEIFNSS